MSTDPFREIFKQSSLRRQLQAGEVLYSCGEPAELCFLVETGELESSLPNRTARRYPQLIRAGEMVGAIDMVLDRWRRRQTPWSCYSPAPLC